MKIEAMKYRDQLRYANGLSVQVLVDERPDRDRFVYHAIGTDDPNIDLSSDQEAIVRLGLNVKRPATRHEGTFYWAECEGEVSFFAHNPRYEAGYGGSTFTLKVHGEDEPRKVKGPWSSRPSVAMRYGAPPCIDVSITDDPDTFRRGYTFTHSYITLALIEEYLEAHGRVVPYQTGEPWTPTRFIVQPEGRFMTTEQEVRTYVDA